MDRGNNFGCHINIKKQSGSVVQWCQRRMVNKYFFLNALMSCGAGHLGFFHKHKTDILIRDNHWNIPAKLCFQIIQYLKEE